MEKNKRRQRTTSEEEKSSSGSSECMDVDYVKQMYEHATGLKTNDIETLYLFWKDGRLFDSGAWTRGWRFLFVRDGFLRGLGADYRAWYRRDFHPDQIDDRPTIERVAPAVETELAELASAAIAH